MFEIENYTQILATTTGGVAGGLIEGLKYSKTKEEKEAKYKDNNFIVNEIKNSKSILIKSI